MQINGLIKDNWIRVSEKEKDFFLHVEEISFENDFIILSGRAFIYNNETSKYSFENSYSMKFERYKNYENICKTYPEEPFTKFILGIKMNMGKEFFFKERYEDFLNAKNKFIKFYNYDNFDVIFGEVIDVKTAYNQIELLLKVKFYINKDEILIESNKSIIISEFNLDNINYEFLTEQTYKYLVNHYIEKYI